MNKYEALILEHGIDVDEIDMTLKGLYCDGMIAISNKIETIAEKSCILAEELGHYYTSVGDITDMDIVANKKQERRARAWGYEERIPPVRFIDAFKHGCNGPHETAAYFEVTETFLADALKYYTEKYGTCLQIGRYSVYFDPVGVFKMFE